MPRFSLRTLIVVMLLGGPVLAGAWWVIQDAVQHVKGGDAKPFHALVAVGFVALMFGLLLSQRKSSAE
jgi:hypothetical protein